MTVLWGESIYKSQLEEKALDLLVKWAQLGQEMVRTRKTKSSAVDDLLKARADFVAVTVDLKAVADLLLAERPMPKG